jgi:hypothetical protein
MIAIQIWIATIAIVAAIPPVSARQKVRHVNPTKNAARTSAVKIRAGNS